MEGKTNRVLETERDGVSTELFPVEFTNRTFCFL